MEVQIQTIFCTVRAIDNIIYLFKIGTNLIEINGMVPAFLQYVLHWQYRINNWFPILKSSLTFANNFWEWFETTFGYFWQRNNDIPLRFPQLNLTFFIDRVKATFVPIFWHTSTRSNETWSPSPHFLSSVVPHIRRFVVSQRF